MAMTLEVAARRRLGDFHVHVRFASPPGITVLFGHSGAGKTSIINMISGLLKPESGRIVVGGRVLFDDEQGINLPPRQRRIGYIFQEDRLFPHLTIRHNLLYGRRFRPPAARFVAFEPVVELLGIEHLLVQRPATLSGGERQRVAIGRALLTSPELLLMDEPLSSLDAPRKQEILPYIERLRDEFRLPIVYVSHAFDEVVRLADQVVLLAHGRVAASGSLTEVTGSLAAGTGLAAEQVGTVVMAAIARHDEVSGLTHLICAAGELVVPRLVQPTGTPVRVHIRALDVSIAVEEPRGLSIQNVLPARIAEIHKADGAYTKLRLDAAGVSLIAHVTHKAERDLELVPGRSVFALIKGVAVRN